MRIIENRNKKTVRNVREQIKRNGGHCICSHDKNEDTKCICKKFRESTTLGFCNCRLYEKVEL